MKQPDVENLEIDLLLEGIRDCYGYDFRGYARASLKRRLIHRMQQMSLNHLSEMIPRILYNRELLGQLLKDMSITVTEMFRDPPFFRAVRETIVPVLKTYPFIKIWHAGCATGEEVYSMAILLKEEGIYNKTQIYATDFNNEALHVAKEGIYPISKIKKSTLNYNKSNGKGCLSDYYHVKYTAAKIDNSLKKQILFANHNLVTDGVFNEMHLIVCRNVLIYFGKELQNQVLSLFCQSLCHRGYLCLGSKETLTLSDIEEQFETIHKPERIFRKNDSFSPACFVEVNST